MNKIFSLLAAMLIVLSTNAQTGKITGSIRGGGSQKTINAATISLLFAKDSSLVKTAVTDKEGNFIFENLKDSTYLILATAVGHTKTYSNTILTAEQTIATTGVLQLLPVEKNLQAVVVTSTKPFIERKADKTIVNVDAMISNTGATALEVLEKSPGITVDKDGKISLKGKQGVMIMLDGKPSYITGQDLTNLLRTMPSSNLDQIEIMTNPSAKYDAAGNAGIINIKTKKNKQKGFNGSINLAYAQGFYPKTNNSLNLNYRYGKFNVFSTISVNARKSFQDLYILRKYKNEDKSINAIFEQNSNTIRKNTNYNAKIGVDFYASKKTTFGIVATGFMVPNSQDGANTTYFQNSTAVLDSIAMSTSYEGGTWKNGSLNFNLRHQFDSTGRELSFDADYVKYGEVKNMNLANNYFSNNWVKKRNDLLEGELPTNINIYTAKIDYVHPLKKDFKIESGVKAGYVTTDNTAGYFNIIGNEKFVDLEKTNRFEYKENINAAYFNISKEIKKWSLQAGVRLENTNNNGYQFGNETHKDSAFKNSYTGLFPNLFVTYKADKNNQFSFSFGRRIRRPDYEDLNPFVFYMDNYTYDRGNPFLQPSYANTFEASHTFKEFLTTSVNYTHTKDLFTEVFEQNGYATVVTQRNYGSSDNANLSVSADIPVAKWWKSMLYTETNYSNYKGIFDVEKVNISATNFLINVNNQFSFKNGWSAELSGVYRTKGIEGQIVIKPLAQLNAGVQKQILQKKGTLKLNIRDFLKTLRQNGNINLSNTDAQFRQLRDNRVATLSFTYRFGKPIKGMQKRKTGGAGDEQNRIKTGGN